MVVNSKRSNETNRFRKSQAPYNVSQLKNIELKVRDAFEWNETKYNFIIKIMRSL